MLGDPFFLLGSSCIAIQQHVWRPDSKNWHNSVIIDSNTLKTLNYEPDKHLEPGAPNAKGDQPRTTLLRDHCYFIPVHLFITCILQRIEVWLSNKQSCCEGKL